MLHKMFGKTTRKWLYLLNSNLRFRNGNNVCIVVAGLDIDVNGIIKLQENHRQREW